MHKSLRSTANAIQNYSFEAKSDELPSLSDKMSLLDIGVNRNSSGGGTANGSSQSGNQSREIKISIENNVAKAGKKMFISLGAKIHS